MSENSGALEALLAKFYEILLSGTKHVSTIEFTIEACHKALKKGNKNTELEKELIENSKKYSSKSQECKIVKLF
jgi:hypothetical protein